MFIYFLTKFKDTLCF